MKGAEIRESFLSYFEGNDHRRVRSSSLIPSQDPTLLFTNAGMVQFKDVFLGSDKRDYRRATTSQKCVRAGGKHNDLENVGRTARHHTFFEMLGNFSFGDYFKDEAIPFAWEYLTGVLGLPEDQMWVSIYKDDDEAAAIWEKTAGVDPSRIVRLGEKDNFWAMGDTGPCGPCSEIIIDQGEDIGCRLPDCRVGCDCDRYLELWNLVFMQYNRDAEGRLTPLPKPSIDTGMGLERLAAILQGKKNNFDTDLFMPIIRFVEEASGVKLGESEKNDVSIRVIADHIRASAFLISDGVIPSNEGRGYVLRRIMRRAGRHGHMLGISGPFIHKGLPVLIGVMGEAYPELRENETYTGGMIRREEERFLSTLEAGLGILGEEIGRLRRKGGKVITGDLIFRLYDTYGFPLDLSEEMAAEEGFELDMAGFEKLMEEQKVRARAAWVGSGEEGAKESWRGIMERTSPTAVDILPDGIGTVTVTGMVVGDAEVEEVTKGGQADIFLDRSPFYGESGGQVGDVGELGGDSTRVLIKGTRRPNEKFIVHLGAVVEGKLKVGQRLTATVDMDRRASISKNHTATHLLQAALRKVLGDHVKQAGSLVAPEKLRFDFTHFGALSPGDIEEVENIVNGVVMSNIPLGKEQMPVEEAMKSGAMAIFGEKYGDRVTVVSVAGFSMELCGGVHVNRTGDIGFFKIISESGVAAGVRRIEAVTGQAALEAVRGEEKIIGELSSHLKVGRELLVDRVKKLSEELKSAHRLLEKEKSASAAESVDAVLDRSEEIGGVKCLVAEVKGQDMKSLRNMIDRLKDRGLSVVVLASVDGDNLFITTGAAGDAVKSVHAGKLAGELAGLAGGKGGGRPDLGQGGARNPERLDEILKEAKTLIVKMMSAGLQDPSLT